MELGNPKEFPMEQTANRKELEAALEAVASRERRRQSKRALVVVGALAVFALLLIILANSGG